MTPQRFSPRSRVLLAASSLLLAGCGSGGAKPAASPTPTATSSPSAAFATCESLNTLPVGKTIKLGPPPINSFQLPTMDIAAHPFVWSNGAATSAGDAETDTAGKAGGSGVELSVNNMTLSVSVGSGQSLTAVRFAFGEFGGNLNLSVNNAFQNFDNFAAVHGKVLGGVSVNVVSGGSGNDSGVIEFVGMMPDQTGGLGQLAVGGQELWIDDICFDK
jgi:hypothetical protein